MIDENIQFVAWFRHASPYIHAHRAHTFVISFDGAAVEEMSFKHLIHDAALLCNLGIRVVLVHGTRHQIERGLRERGQSWRYANGIRVTDATALACATAACGEINARIHAMLSMGLANVPQMDPVLRDEAATIRIVSGNYLTAKPVGIRDGVDFMYTGEVRHVDCPAIQRHLDEGNLVLVPPIGYSPSGELFNLTSEDVATSVAIALRANKWICLTEDSGLFDKQGKLMRQIVLQDAQQMLKNAQGEDMVSQLRNAVRACANGVQRIHFIPRRTDGGLLLELFSRDGIGTMISGDPYEHLRIASVEDVPGVIALIEPLETEGILVRRSREKLEMEIHHFVVQERDGMIVACAALYPLPEEGMGELACLAVHPAYRKQQRGDALLGYIERAARNLNLSRLFVLTTRTAHWFIERGFEPADIEVLPGARRQMYNFQRQSKVFVKAL